VEVISGIIFRRNHRGIQKVSSVRQRDGFTDEYANRITEGFKMAAPYGDETGSPMKNADGITEGFKMAAPYGDVSYLSSE
jgi:hypothetical protein